MSATKNPTTITTPQTQDERIELANQLFREFFTRCFWHSPRALIITEDLIPFVVKGLRKYGGHRGFQLASKLQPKQDFPPIPDQEGVECR
jgi:hypothetical protein